MSTTTNPKSAERSAADCLHSFRPGEVRCVGCPAHRGGCDCPRCEPTEVRLRDLAGECPPWCDGDDCGTFNTGDGKGRVVRDHRRAIRVEEGAPFAAFVFVTEALVLTEAGPRFKAGRPYVLYNDDAPGVSLDAQGCRDLAAVLVRAAAAADEAESLAGQS
ncbi:MAG: hypothetical protein WAS07_11795 [Micropruina sp.]